MEQRGTAITSIIYVLRGMKMQRIASAAASPRLTALRNRERLYPGGMITWGNSSAAASGSSGVVMSES